MNENGNTTHQNLCYTAKPVLRGKFKDLNAYIIEQKKVSNQQSSSYLKNPEKEDQSKPKARRKIEIEI